MGMSEFQKFTIRSAALLFLLFSTAVIAFPQVTPNPILVFSGQEPYKARGVDYIRYKYFVFNGSSFPAAMFAPSPDLPPCGTNTKSSRTWVDIFDQRGVRLNGFCALAKGADLDAIWFTLEAGSVPPSWVYIELSDRKTNIKYKSNLAETVL